jgi:hypothetical protein
MPQRSPRGREMELLQYDRPRPQKNEAQRRQGRSASEFRVPRDFRAPQTKKWASVALTTPPSPPIHGTRIRLVPMAPGERTDLVPMASPNRKDVRNGNGILPETQRTTQVFRLHVRFCNIPKDSCARRSGFPAFFGTKSVPPNTARSHVRAVPRGCPRPPPRAFLFVGPG